jgi:hypothetical protein
MAPLLPGVGHGRVLDEHGRSLRADDEVANETLVVGEVTGDPHRAVEEHEGPGIVPVATAGRTM